MFSGCQIDSLKVRIKRENVNIIDKRLITDFIAYYPTIEHLDGEQQQLGDEFRKAEPFTKIINGITYRIYIKAFIGNDRLANEYVVFQISAKMLKEKYFDGITADNYRTIVDDINSFGVLHVSYDNFLKGLVSDIDICINQLIDRKSLKGAFSFIENNPVNGKYPLINVFQREGNVGIEFNKREKATNTTPYAKIYHKGLELMSKSVVFYRAYLEPMRTSVLDNLVRYEFTIKAAKHKKFLCEKGFKADFKTLYDLLKCPEKELLKIAKSGIPFYLEPKAKLKIDKEQSPTDIAFQYYIANLVALGWDEQQLLAFTAHIDCPVAKSRTKTKIKKLIDEALHADKVLKTKLEINSRANHFLKTLGVNL